MTKVKYSELKGVSARLEEAELEKLKTRMAVLKKTHGSGFSLADLLKVVSLMDIETLDREIRKSAVQNPDINLVKKMNVSDATKAKIAALIAEESQEAV